MEPVALTTADLLDAWRDAIRAAELAARLAIEAERSADEAEAGALASEEIAALAERVAEAAGAAAAAARQAANRAAALARERRDGVASAQGTEQLARRAEAEAGRGFREAEDDARRQHAGRGDGAA